MMVGRFLCDNTILTKVFENAGSLRWKPAELTATVRRELNQVPESRVICDLSDGL